MLLTSKQHILGILEENYSSLFHLLHMIWPWNVSGIRQWCWRVCSWSPRWSISLVGFVVQVYPACGQNKVFVPDWWDTAALLHLFNCYNCLRGYISRKSQMSSWPKYFQGVLFSFIICSTAQPYVVRGIFGQRYQCWVAALLLFCTSSLGHWKPQWTDAFCRNYFLLLPGWRGLGRQPRIHCAHYRRYQRSDCLYSCLKKKKKGKTTGSALHLVRSIGLAVASRVSKPRSIEGKCTVKCSL